MHHDTPVGPAVTLAFGSLLINTMPVWLVALAEKAGGGNVLPGLLASGVLLAAAAGCFIARGVRHRAALRASALVVAVLPVLAVLADTAAPGVLLAAGVMFGLAFGVVLGIALAALLAVRDPARTIGDTLALALIASLAILVAGATLMLPLLAALSVLQAIVAVARHISPTQARRVFEMPRPNVRDFGLTVFFIAMGAYWAFLEAYAELRGFASIAEWLAGGLVASAAGSALAARLPRPLRLTCLPISMLASASSGALTYAATAPSVIGVSILINAFFLFLFFPLYLEGGNVAEAGARMANYLAGFALGGLFGAAIIGLSGFAALAVAIALGGLIALPSSLSLGPGPAARS